MDLVIRRNHDPDSTPVKRSEIPKNAEEFRPLHSPVHRRQTSKGRLVVQEVALGANEVRKLIRAAV
jgi:hypothetical protein